MSSSSPGSDQRHFPRFQADVPAIASLVSDSEILSFRVWCDNISEGGVGTFGLESVALGDLVSFELHIPISKQPVWVDAIVRHGGGRRGLEFLPLGDDQRSLIKRYCRLQPEENCRR